jgi:RNA polymerase sigma-70 factor (ECF subfamily)
MTESDVSLMLRLKKGDAAAFDLLVARHRDWMVNILWKMVGNLDDAEDLAQEAFLRMYRARKSYRPTAGYRTWARRIATNLALNHRRKKSAVRLVYHGEDPRVRPPDRNAAQDEAVRRIWKSLHELPPRQRAALVLTRIEGASYREAALAMDVSLEAVRSLVARARATLRARLRAETSPGEED